MQSESFRPRASVALLAAALLLTVVSGPLFYVSTVVDDEDAFVAVADQIVDHPDIRRELSALATTITIDALAADELLADALPDQTRSLAVPLARFLSTRATDAAFAAFDTQIARDAREAALRELHSQVTADTDTVVVDLRAVLVRTSRELAGPAVGAAAAKYVSTRDTGRFTLAEPGSGNAAAFAAVRALPGIGGIVAIITLLTLATAVLLAVDRRAAVVRVGLVIAAGALLSTLLVALVLYLVLGPQGLIGPAIADTLSADFAAQQRGVMVNGLVLAGAGVLFGSRPAAVAARQIPHALWNRSDQSGRLAAEIVGDNTPLARIVTWLVGVVILVGWPAPTLRVVLTVVGMALLAQVAIWILTAGGEVAGNLRSRLSLAPPPDSDPDQLSRLRVNVAVLTLLGLLFWPAWSQRSIIGAFVIGAVAQAVIDFRPARLLAQAKQPISVTPVAGSRRRLILTGATLAVVAALGIAATMSSAESAEAATGCNGHVELCDRGLDETVFAGSHNSMSSTDLGWELAMQTGDIIAQLDTGIRALLIDTHYWDEAGQIDGQADNDAATVIESALADDRPRPGTWLCHGFCALGATDFEAALADLRIWLDTNPREVILMIIQDEISTADTIDAFTSTGLVELVHIHEPGTPWPTLGELIEANERLLVYAENEGAPDSWYQNVWADTFTETPFSFALRSDFSCAPNRGDTDNPLFLINHWLSTGIPVIEAAAVVNSHDALMARVEACQSERGRLPTVIATDFVQTGDLISVVDELNDVTD